MTLWLQFEINNCIILKFDFVTCLKIYIFLTLLLLIDYAKLRLVMNLLISNVFVIITWV